LKGGDPMLFGRAQEEISALEAAGVEYEVVPGVTAACAASAELGVSLTQRGLARSVVFLTPRVGEGEKPNEWAKTAAIADTVVIYMGAGQAEAIASALIAHGVEPGTPVVVTENASLPEARTFEMTLRELPMVAELGLTGPALITIGEVYRERVAKRVAARAKARCA
jgi:uroporphyrin-III C-methyltransferase